MPGRGDQAEWGVVGAAEVQRESVGWPDLVAAVAGCLPLLAPAQQPTRSSTPPTTGCRCHPRPVRTATRCPRLERPERLRRGATTRGWPARGPGPWGRPPGHRLTDAGYSAPSL